MTDRYDGVRRTRKDGEETESNSNRNSFDGSNNTTFDLGPGVADAATGAATP